MFPDMSRPLFSCVLINYIDFSKVLICSNNILERSPDFFHPFLSSALNHLVWTCCTSVLFNKISNILLSFKLLSALPFCLSFCLPLHFLLTAALCLPFFSLSFREESFYCTVPDRKSVV